MRTPWRDALDGKVKCIRDLNSASGIVSLETYLLAGFNALGQEPSEVRLRAIANEYRRNLSASLMNAEPFYLTNDMVSYFVRQMQSLDIDRVVNTFKLPVENGLLWFPAAVDVTDDPDAGVGHVLSVRAIAFARASSGKWNGQQLRAANPDGQHDVLGVFAMIEAGRSGFDQLDAARLIPFINQPVRLDSPIRRWAELTARTYNVSYERAHQLWAPCFLFTVFDAIEKRIIRFGGSGVERAARKAAERAGLSSSTVQVVEWRKAVYQYPDGHTPQQIDWSCQWDVRAHTRRLKSGKLVNVRPYRKGPDDKPLKQQRTRAHIVKR